MKIKLVLGTANFSPGYGIQGGYGLNYKQINKISMILKKYKVNFIDTAFSYYGVEKKIGESKLKNLNIYSKIPKIGKKLKTEANTLLSQLINKSLKKLRKRNFEGIYFHNADDLLGNHGKLLYQALEKQKNQGLVKKIGVSVYSPWELKKILKKYSIDIIQIPINIFDQRFLKKNFLKKIKKKGIEIHARSIFLQGILLLDYNKLPKYFKKWHNLFKQWDNWNKINNQKKVYTCLEFIRRIKYIDKIIFGISSLRELKEIMQFKKFSGLKMPSKFLVNDKKLLDPRLWKKT